MRKIFLIASREYQAAVRSKSFVFSLLLMPLMMAGTFIFQELFQDTADLSDIRWVLIDHSHHPELVNRLKERINSYNQELPQSAGTENRPHLQLVEYESLLALSASNPKLPEQLRSGTIAGVLEIWPPGPIELAAGSQVVVRYQSSSARGKEFPGLVLATATAFFREKLGHEAGLSDKKIKTFANPVTLDAPAQTLARNRVAAPTATKSFPPQLITVVLMILMFVVVMMTATPLMQGVVEEKMQRIAEVLLGSVYPFQLMMGKLVGTTAVSMSTALVYLGGAYWSAHHFGFAEDVSVSLLLWFVLFQALASLMFGSLFIAIGASCTDMRESQNLLWPVLVLACLPLFLISKVLREPNGALIRGLSFFPFATPTLMVARQSMAPGVPSWELALGIMILLTATLLGVLAAGRIFRAGILMQGKGSKLSDMLKWALRG